MKILLLLLGLLVLYIIGRRRFNRRSLAGVQGFKTYGNAILTMTIETIFKFIANVTILIAIILLI